jgi:hypothetical protein
MPELFFFLSQRPTQITENEANLPPPPPTLVASYQTHTELCHPHSHSARTDIPSYCQAPPLLLNLRKWIEYLAGET